MSIHRLLVSAVVASCAGTAAMLGLYRSASLWCLLLACVGVVCFGNVVAVYMALMNAEEPEVKGDQSCPQEKHPS